MTSRIYQVSKSPESSLPMTLGCCEAERSLELYRPRHEGLGSSYGRM